MVKKVSLDAMEIKELDIPLPERTESVAEVNSESSRKWPLSRGLCLSALTLVLLIAAGGVLYWWISSSKTAVPLSKKVASGAASLQKGPLTAQVNDFIITLQDSKGKYLVLACDLTFELNAGQDAVFRQNIVKVRNNIYEILNNTKSISRPGPKSRDELKEEINKSISGLLGTDAIKAIYFTKFIVL